MQILGLFVNANIFSGGVPDALAFDLFGTGAIDNGSSLQGELFSFKSDPVSSFNFGTFVLTVLPEDASGIPINLHADYTATISPANNVPEPGTLMLLASGLLAGFLVIRRAAH